MVAEKITIRNNYPLLALAIAEIGFMKSPIRPPYLLTLLLLLALAPALAAQPAPDAPTHLRRRCYLGIMLKPLGDSLAKVAGVAGGVLAEQVLPNGTLEAIGGKSGDIITRFNGQAIPNWPTLRPMLGKTFEGDAVSVEVWRNGPKKGKSITLTGTIKGTAREQSTAHYDVQYGEAPFQGGYLRTITMLPKAPGPHDIIYFIPGYSCFSIDHMNAQDAYPRLFDSLANLGHIIYRVDKPGMGDGPSPCDCRETGFDQELAAFEAGYAHLRAQPWAQEDRIFLVGHSMGGIQAPLLATSGTWNPKGIAVYGTVFQTWYEYILMLLRFQMPKANPDYVSFEQDMAEYIPLFYEHYILHKPLAEIIAHPKWKELLERDFQLDAEGNLLYRKGFYWEELARHTLGDAWAKTSAHVLSIFGEADFEVFDSFSMAEIANIVNAHHPGHGSYVALPGTNHGMVQVGSMQKGLEWQADPAYGAYSATHFDYRLVTELHTWILRVMKAG
jgi:uncharacterized protein